MNNQAEWENEQLWIEVEENGLYPPEKITKIKGAIELIKDDDFSAKKVLDDGCGTGWFGKMLQDRGVDVIGTDISDTLLEEASKYIKVKKASAYDLPFDEESFNYVISFMVIQVLENPDKALTEIYRILKPNGIFYFGIVHPMAEKWDEKTGKCYEDFSNYESIEKRPWIFNLKDGRRFIKHYIHRPLSFYENEFKNLFNISKKLEPKFPNEMTENGKYAKTEYLFIKLTKK